MGKGYEKQLILINLTWVLQGTLFPWILEDCIQMPAGELHLDNL